MARSKPKPALEDLRRRLVLLDRLRGRPLRTAEGVALIDLSSRRATIRDPWRLYQACIEGWPSATTIAATVDLATPPLILKPALLATMQRDLRALRKWPELRQTLREAPQLFRRFGEIDSAWFSETRERLTRAATLLRAAKSSDSALGSPQPDDPQTSKAGSTSRRTQRSKARQKPQPQKPRGPEAGSDRTTFHRVCMLVAALRGQASAQAMERGNRRLENESRDRRRRARHRLRSLLEALQTGIAPRDPQVAAAFHDCRSALRLPGRSRRRRLEHSLGRLLEIPPSATGTTQADDPTNKRRHRKKGEKKELISQVNAIGERLITTILPAPNETDRAQNRRFFGLYGLAFEPLPRRGSSRPIELPPTLVRRALHDFKGAQEALGDLELTLDEVLRLRRLDGADRQVAVFVAAGVPIATVEAIAESGALPDFSKISSSSTALAYAEWFSTLAPHYTAMGLELPFKAMHLQRLTKRKGTRRDLGVLALCLMTHHRDPSKTGAEAA
ncbi:MAG TPA: hypothetical protein ENJ18_19580, partial [Nannocystis exedens]|nr:hypothetical protein [Nannocystis exedens]